MAGNAAIPEPSDGYVSVGGLRMYHDSLGEGRPVLLLHGGVTTTELSFGRLRPYLARQRRTIGIEQQGHGRTADLDRPMSYEQMVEDTAAVLDALEIAAADVVGWSDGGIIALGLAAHRPDLVRRVAAIGAGYSADADTPEIREMLQAATPDDPNLEPFRAAYAQVAPRPEDWPVLIDKAKAMWRSFRGWDPDDMRRIAAPVLLIVGDRDFVRLDHALELFRMLPDARLAVLPGTDHAAPFTRADWIAPMLVDFLDATPGSTGSDPN